MKAVAVMSKRSKKQVAVVSKKMRPLRKRFAKLGATASDATTRAQRLIAKNPVLAAVTAAALLLAVEKLRRTI